MKTSDLPATIKFTNGLTANRLNHFDEAIGGCAPYMDEQITHLYNANHTTQAIADALNIPQWQVADTLARLRASDCLTRRKRTTLTEARQLLTKAGADFTALASTNPRVWQAEAGWLIDAGFSPSQIARFTAVSKARVCAWAKGRKS